MRKLLIILGLLIFPSISFAGTLTISPNTGETPSDIIVTDIATGGAYYYAVFRDSDKAYQYGSFGAPSLPATIPSFMTNPNGIAQTYILMQINALDETVSNCNFPPGNTYEECHAVTANVGEASFTIASSTPPDDTATTTATTTTDILYSDWLLVNSVIIFILGLVASGYLWSIFKVKK